MKRLKPVLLIPVIVVVAVGIIFTIVKAGSLNPPGPVGSSMRTLQEIYDYISTRASQADVSRLDVAVSSRAPKLDFAGYTSGYTGNLGWAKGANEKCDTRYDGSHWCSVDEIIRLGDDYPWANTVWVRDAVKGAYWNGTSVKTIAGGAGADQQTLEPYQSTCASWLRAEGTYYGPVLASQGYVFFAQCSNQYSLGCCY